MFCYDMPMPLSPELAQYLNQARASGMTDEAIRTELLKAGWQVSDVNEAIPARTPSFAPVVAPGQVSVPLQIKPKRGHTGFYIIVVFLLLVGGATYFFLPQIVTYVGKLMGKTEEVTPLITDDDVRPIVPVDEAASSQTYRNEKYGFEFKYPVGWGETDVFQGLKRDSVAIIDLSQEGKYKSSLIPDTDVGALVMQDAAIFILPPTGIDWMANLTDKSLMQKQSLVVGGEQVELIVESSATNPNIFGGGSSEYYVFRREGVTAFVIHANYSSTTPGGPLKESLNQILSTFKFISPTATTTSSGTAKVTLRGVVLENNTGCAYDATCTLTINTDDKKMLNIVYGGGLTQRQVCYVSVQDNLKKGDRVELFGELTEDGKSILCTQDAYVKKI